MFRVWYSTPDCHHGDGGDGGGGGEGGDGVRVGGAHRGVHGDGVGGWRVEGGGGGGGDRGDGREEDDLFRCVRRLPRASSELQHQSDHAGPPVSV